MIWLYKQQTRRQENKFESLFPLQNASLAALLSFKNYPPPFFFLICNIFFFQDHIQEVLNKWQSIDDEIWAKIIVLERNRRVAKAYARAPVLTVNGSDDGFDGFRIGLAGFDNPMRDAKTEEVKRHIGQVL